MTSVYDRPTDAELRQLDRQGALDRAEGKRWWETPVRAEPIDFPTYITADALGRRQSAWDRGWKAEDERRRAMP